MNVQNFAIKNLSKRKNNPLLPSSLRGLIIGRSNSGKTVLLLNLLLRDGWLDYDNLLVFGNSLHQDEYQILKKAFEMKLSKQQVLNLFKNQKDIEPLKALEHYRGEANGKISAEFYENCDAIPDPKTLDSKKKNLLILDDCYLGKQNKAGAYYTRGRHSNCDSLFISQNYFALPRNSIRENSNFIILYPQNSKSVLHIWMDHCTDLPFEEFSALCQQVWGTKYNFLTIDLTRKFGKYRENLDKFYIPGKMAFVDPSNREKFLQEYVKTRNEIRENSENEKENNLLKTRAIEANARPIVAATEKSAEKIAEVLQKKEAKPPTGFSKNKDKYFSLLTTDDGYKLGDKDVQIDDANNIIIGEAEFPYTKGLFDLIMLNKPDDGEYTPEDLENYKKIVKMTNLISNPHSTGGKHYYKITMKYRFLENLFLNGRKRPHVGEGIILPGDINGLRRRLQLVCAERAAGNIEATTPEIVAILDAMLNQNYISKKEYNEVCKGLKC